MKTNKVSEIIFLSSITILFCSFIVLGINDLFSIPALYTRGFNQPTHVSIHLIAYVLFILTSRENLKKNATPLRILMTISTVMCLLPILIDIMGK